MSFALAGTKQVQSFRLVAAKLTSSKMSAINLLVILSYTRLIFLITHILKSMIFCG